MLDFNEPIRLSKWCHVLIDKRFDDFAVYHALNIDVVFLENHFFYVIEYLKKGTSGNFIIEQSPFSEKENVRQILEELFCDGFIVKISDDEDLLLVDKRSSYLSPPGLETLYLIVSDQCNLGCDYCFINHGIPENYTRKKMDWNVAKKAVDMFFFNISKNPEYFDDKVKMIFFYGGEPLLNFDILKKVVLYIEERYSRELNEMGENFRFNIISNGTIIDKEIAKFVSNRKNIAISLSVDGNKNTHDVCRKYPDGSGTFTRIMEGYKKLKEFGCNVSISCTVGEHNLNSLKDLLILNREYNFSAINMNLLLDTREKFVSEEYMNIASDNLLSYFEQAREEGVYEDRIMRKLKSFISKDIHAFDCQATGNQLVCSPDGFLGVCQEGIGGKDFFFDYVRRDFDFHNHPTIKEWNKRSPLNMPQCYNCYAIGICGGGCAFSAWLRNGSIWSIDSRFCVHSCKTLEWLIWDLYKTLS